MVKSQQLKEKNPYLGVDCKETGTNDMKEQGVFCLLYTSPSPRD